MDSIYYPRLLRRIQASFIDAALIVICIYAIAFLPPMGEWSFLKPLFLIAVILIFEPVLVAFTGGTIGHHVMRIRVTRSNGKGNINILMAMARFILKAFVGWLSYAVVLTTRRHQALHDMAAKSVVVYKSVARLPARERLVDRQALSDIYIMPSRWRRFGIGLAYFVAVYIIWSIAITFSISESCSLYGHCRKLDSLAIFVGDTLLFGLWCATIVFAWRGQLYGARRKAKMVREDAHV